MSSIDRLPPLGPPSADRQSREILLSSRDLSILVYRQMRGFAGPHRELDDLAQTALEHVLRADFQGRSKLSTFTYAVCYRVWLKHLRFASRFRTRFVEQDEGREPEENGADPESLLETRRKFARLYEALAQISPKNRAVVSLRDIMGLEVSEIVDIVGANEATVRTRLRDGRKKLRKLLEGDPLFAHFSASVPCAPTTSEVPCPQS